MFSLVTLTRTSRNLKLSLLHKSLYPYHAIPKSCTVAIRSEFSTSFRSLHASTRAYAAAAEQLKETEEDDFFAPDLIQPSYSKAIDNSTEDGFVTRKPSKANGVVVSDVESGSARSSGTSSGPLSPTVSTSGAAVPQSFLSIKGRMNYDTLKALTFKPFVLKDMSEVQKRVLGRMPELSGGKTSQKVVESENEEETAARLQRVSRGKEDLLVKAKTGTGKTIAFLVPAIESRIHQLDTLSKKPDEEGRKPTASEVGQILRKITRSHVGTLIISPTRELATQIANEASKLCTWHKEFQVQLFVGGNSRRDQLKNWTSIRNGRKDIVVATPGRLRDLLSEPVVAEALRTTEMLVLDEADTLLEMGFSNDLNFILQHLPSERQTFLFSATVSPAIAKVAKSCLKSNHTVIDCVPKNESNVHLHIPQYYTALSSADQQIPHVVRLIAQDQLLNPQSKVIVFLPTTKQTMLFATLLRELSSSLPQGLSVHEIHSRLDQNRRSRASERFRRDNRASILVTSDVSARGVDYPGVTRVIQVGIPGSADQYIHRVGRTGRGGKEGGRGDLVLLPFETGFINTLRQIPIKPVEVDDLKADVTDLAVKRGTSSRQLDLLETTVGDLLPTLDPDAVSEVFQSLLGYYVGKTQEIGSSPQRVLEGLKQWSVEGAGLPEPPYLSASFLAKLGMNRGSGGRGGSASRGGNFGKRDSWADRSSSNRPRDFGDREARQPRSFGDRDARQPRSFNDREARQPRSFSDRQSRDFGDRDTQPRDLDREARQPRDYGNPGFRSGQPRTSESSKYGGEGSSSRRASFGSSSRQDWADRR